MERTFRGVLLASMLLYLGFSFAGLRYGLPSQKHFFSYSSDEATWIIGLSRIDIQAGKWSPYPIFHEPPFYLLVYGGAVLAAGHLGFLSAQPQWSPQEARVEIYARLHLLGRYLQILFGVLTLLVMGVAARALYGPVTAMIATVLMVVTPSFIAASHFSQDNLPVMTLSLLSLCFLLCDASPSHRAPKKWLLIGAFCGGVAMATKYSAAPLLIPFLYRAWKRNDRWRTTAQVMFFVLIGFVCASPFILSDPKGFLEGFGVVAQRTVGSLEGIGARLSFPFLYSLNYSLGAPLLFLTCVAAGRYLRSRDEGIRCLALWLGGLLLGIYAAGEQATPARVLIFAPAAVLWVARMFAADFNRPSRAQRWAAGIILGFSACISLVIVLMIVRLRTAPPVQQVASDWMQDHLPVGSRIGVPRMPYFWTPDIINSQNAKGDLPQTPFKVSDVRYTIEMARTQDFLVVSDAECNAWVKDASTREFCGWVASEKEFVTAKRFDRRLQWGPFSWNRPTRPYQMPDDDLWVTPLTLYARKT